MREGAKASVLYFAFCVLGVGRRREDGRNEVLATQLEDTEAVGRCVRAWIEER